LAINRTEEVEKAADLTNLPESPDDTILRQRFLMDDIHIAINAPPWLS
jgi:hypothetical protein